MKDWYELMQGLETEVTPLDELASARIESRVLSVLPRRKRKFHRMIAVVAALFLLSACGYAAISQYSHWFWNYAENPHSPEDSEDLLASMGTVIGQSQTVNGVTATLHGALLDTDTILLSLTFEGDDFPDTLWSNVQSQDSWLCPSEAQIKQSWAKSLNMTEEETDAYFEEHQLPLQERYPPDSMTYIYNRQSGTYALQVEDTVPFSGDTLELTLHLENLSVEHRVGQELLTHTVEGPFEFTFTAERKDVRQVWFGQQELLLAEQVPVQVTKITLSPLHASVKFAGVEKLPVKGGFGDLEQLGYGHSDCRISALRIAGEELAIPASGGSSGNSAGPDGSWGGAVHAELPRVVDPATVEAVCLGGIWLELEDFVLMESAAGDTE